MLCFLPPKWQLGFKAPSTIYLINYKVKLHNFYSHTSVRDGLNRKIYEKQPRSSSNKALKHTLQHVSIPAEDSGIYFKLHVSKFYWSSMTNKLIYSREKTFSIRISETTVVSSTEIPYLGKYLLWLIQCSFWRQWQKILLLEHKFDPVAFRWNFFMSTGNGAQWLNMRFFYNWSMIPKSKSDSEIMRHCRILIFR